jgi:hypothetical protein
MKKLVALVMLMMLVGTLMVACGPDKTDPAATETPGEKLVYSSESARPNWTLTVPEESDGKMYFVGRSQRLATEQLAHQRAMNDARTQVSNNMGALIKSKLETARVDFGLATDVINPTESSRQYERFLTANYVSGAKDEKVYIEKWQTETGYGWQYWTLVAMPKKSLDQSASQFAMAQSADNMRKAKEASDAQAKQQLETAGKMWAQLSEQGLFND